MKTKKLICKLVSLCYIISFITTILNILFFFLGAHELVVPFSVRTVVLTPLVMMIGQAWWPLVVIILFLGILLLSFFNFYKVKKNNLLPILSLLVYTFDLFFTSYIFYRNNFVRNNNDFGNIPCIISNIIMVILIVIGIIMKRKIIELK